MNILDEMMATISPQQEQRVFNRMMMAARIDDARIAKGWTQKELAKKLDKNDSEISKWLSGTHNFTLDTLSDLSTVLEVDLLGLEEPKQPVVEAKVVHFGTIMVPASRTTRCSQPSVVSFTDFQRGISPAQA